MNFKLKTYTLVGVTEYAETYLSLEDLETLRDMIGCEVTECFKTSVIDGDKMFTMPDGIKTHYKYLKLEEND